MTYLFKDFLGLDFKHRAKSLETRLELGQRGQYTGTIVRGRDISGNIITEQLLSSSEIFTSVVA